jgi:hypothetical protein
MGLVVNLQARLHQTQHFLIQGSKPFQEIKYLLALANRERKQL